MTRVTAELTEGYAVTIEGAGHYVQADEPEDAGGTDTGPTPYELLLSALAACTTITISMYCQRKGWTLDKVTASYEHDRVHADDCADCDDERTGYIDRVRGQVTIHGEFDDAQRARLAQVAARCPVHKTLEHGIHFEDTVDVP